MMELGLRLGNNPRVMVSTTPKPIPLIKRLVKDESCALTRGTTYDNRANLAQKFYERTVSRLEGTRLGRQELMAERSSQTIVATRPSPITVAKRFADDGLPSLDMARPPPTTSLETN
jgi:phage terminase large subunit-like protein